MSLEGRLLCVLEGVEHPDEHYWLELWYQPPNRFHLLTRGHEGYEVLWRFDLDLHVFLPNLERALMTMNAGSSRFKFLSAREQVRVIQRDAWQVQSDTCCDCIALHARRDPSFPYLLFFDFYQKRTRVDVGLEMYVKREALWEMINRINGLAGT